MAALLVFLLFDIFADTVARSFSLFSFVFPEFPLPVSLDGLFSATGWKDY